MGATDRLISALGYVSREVYDLTPDRRSSCFYCLGSMGSVIPLALGLAIAQPGLRMIALEGDGSLLMNLGTLATLARYGSGTVSAVVFDNGCYESTGGQPSRASKFRLEAVAEASGLRTAVARDPSDVREHLMSSVRPTLIVARVCLTAPAPRIVAEPRSMAEQFSRGMDR